MRIGAVAPACGLFLAAVPGALAQETVTTETAPSIEELRRRLDAAEAKMDAQAVADRGIIEELRVRNAAQRAELEELRRLLDTALGASVTPVVAASTDDEEPPDSVGERPDEEPGARLDLFATRGGILTPKNSVVSSTSFRYSTSTDNRFYFSGVELVDAFLVGLIQATDTRRTSVGVTQTVSYGLTGRIEIDASVPYVSQRNERTANDISTGDNETLPQDLSATGFGDLSFGVHAQLNQPRGRVPYFIANIRVKAANATGPFDVDFDENGNPQQAATGSGYWSIEPSLTIIKQSDPVVLFANLGYQINQSTDIGKDIRGSEYVDFDAGDGIRLSAGLGISLNEHVSLNFGYEHTAIAPSMTDIRQTDGRISEIEGRDAVIASSILGVTYRLTPRVSAGMTATIGTTEEAPDASLSFSIRKSFR